MGRRIISASRFLVVITVLCIFLAATALVVYGAVDTYHIIAELIQEREINSDVTKHLVVEFIELVDLFLLSTVLYVVALGLYELFVDDRLPLPKWMVIHNLDDLKNKLIAVIIVVLAVAFLGQVIGATAPQDLFWLGAGVSLVIAALTLFLRYEASIGKHGDDAEPPEHP